MSLFWDSSETEITTFKEKLTQFQLKKIDEIEIDKISTRSRLSDDAKIW